MFNYYKINIGIIILCLILSCINALCEPSESTNVSVVIVGDIMFDSGIAQLIEKEGSSLAPFAGVLPIIRDADITFGTFEGVITTRGEPIANKSVVLRSKRATARSLANAGFDIISLATSHVLDYGDEGFLDTLEVLSWYGIKYVGAGIDLQEARKAIVLDAKDTKVGFLGYHRGSQFDRLFFASENKLGPALPIYEELEQDLIKAKSESDIVIVSMNWGPRVKDDTIGDRQKLYAKRLIDAGADIVIGQRVNTLQGVEIYNGKPIFYSLGDFLYGNYASRAPYGYVLRLIIFEKKLSKVEIIPISLSNTKTGSYLPEVISDQQAQEAILFLQKLSEEFGTEFQIEDGIGIIKLN